MVVPTPQQMADSGDLGILYTIDFGLSSVSAKIEDKAVDFYVLKRAFISTHPGSEALFEKIIEIYKSKVQKGLQIIAKFRDVEMRGRKRECFG
jgi:TP53 regulating kinase-like protein